MRFETRFKILKPQDQPDGYGGYKPVLTQIGYIWGHIFRAEHKGAALSGTYSQSLKKTIILRNAPPVEFSLGTVLHDGKHTYEIDMIGETTGHTLSVTALCQEFENA